MLFLFSGLLYNFCVHYLNDDPCSERKPSHKGFPLGDAVHLVGAFGELFEDLLFLVVHSFLQSLFMPDDVAKQLCVGASFLEIPFARRDVAVPSFSW